MSCEHSKTEGLFMLNIYKGDTAMCAVLCEGLSWLCTESSTLYRVSRVHRLSQSPTALCQDDRVRVLLQSLVSLWLCAVPA